MSMKHVLVLGLGSALGLCACAAEEPLDAPVGEQEQPSGAYAMDPTERWTTTKTVYCDISALSNVAVPPATYSDQAIVTDALSDEALPLDFVMWTSTSSAPPGPYIKFKYDTTGNVDPGAGAADIPLDPTQDKRVVIRLTTPTKSGTIRHETGHALGLIHEFTRSDRDDNIDLYCDCAENGCGSDGYTPANIGGFDNFGKVTTSANFGPFDFDSIMMYSSDTLCAPVSATDPTCQCPVMLKKDDDSWFAGGGGSWSAEDRNALYQMYEPVLGANEADDQFGSATTAGDFDGDGYDDLAVGAPGESPWGGPKAGLVFLYKGTYANGLVPWQTIRETTFGVEHDGDRFGAALASRDLNGDGREELIIGAPGYQTATNVHAGAVFYLKGSSWYGLSGGGLLTQGSLGHDTDQDGDQFGATVAGIEIGADGHSYVAVGAYNKLDAGKRSGKVTVLRWNNGALHWWDGFTNSAGTSGAGDYDQFGWAMLGSDINEDGITDLAVGAPGKSSSQGRLYIYSGASGHWAVTPITYQITPASSNDRFGYAIAGGDVDNSGTTDLAVGIPGMSGSGRVVTMKNTSTGTYFVLNSLQTLDQTMVGQTNQSGDLFGATIRMKDINEDGYCDIVVGIPYKDNSGSGGADAGQADFFRSNGSTGMMGTHSGEYFSFSDGSSRFGSSISIGNFDKRSFNGKWDIVIGAPLYNTWGRFREYYSDRTLRRGFSQETSTWR